MNFVDAIQAVFKKYATFEGRSLRSEYWYWALFTLIASIILGIIDSSLRSGSGNDIGVLRLIFSIATFVPSLAVTIRRLHDVNRSGWWILIGFTIVGIIPLLYWYCKQGTDGKNRFGLPAPAKP